MDFGQVPQIGVKNEDPRSGIDPCFGPNPAQRHGLQHGVNLEEVEEEKEEVPQQQRRPLRIRTQQQTMRPGEEKTECVTEIPFFFIKYFWHISPDVSWHNSNSLGSVATFHSLTFSK